MKKLRRNNKGFSLVELIVVVLIMAIIAVALAPQVMKWVGNSRDSTDAQIYDSLVSDAQTALTKETVWKGVKDATSDITITIKNDGTTVGNDAGGFKTELEAVAGKSVGDIKANTAPDDGYVITVKKGTGSVERSTPPTPDTNK